jgi:hypothetical protein
MQPMHSISYTCHAYPQSYPSIHIIMSVQVTPSNTLRTNFNPCRPGFQDRVYKVVSGVQLPVRIWPARKGGEGTGWLIWIHGGGESGSTEVCSCANAWECCSEMRRAAN